jgi:hypothetical protein
VKRQLSIISQDADIYTLEPDWFPGVTYWEPVHIYSDEDEQNREDYNMASISYSAHPDLMVGVTGNP